MSEIDLPSQDSLTTGKRTLLMVDDEAPVLSALRRLFRPHGYEILQATSGAAGLEILRAQKVDLVISDMRMPEMDGVHLLEAVKAFDPTIVRILLTGYADIGSTISAINRGELHRYISKPWDDRDIVLTVREALARRDLEQRNAQLVAMTQSQNEQLTVLNQGLEARVAARTAELEQVNAMLNTSYDEVNQNFMLAVTVFSGLLEMRQDGIAGHSRRVAALAQRTAVILKLDERERQDIYLAALLHDIGKIGFPDKMLGKPVSTYSPEEQARYRRHPLDGEAALMPLARLHKVARIVRQHHERVDGNGFPDALQGDEIALGARIVAAASDYDALVNGSMAERHYTPEMARQALRGSVGTSHDGPVVDALLEALVQLQNELRTDVEIDSRELKPGMVLAKDLLSSRGVMLLAAGYVFEARVIRQVVEFATRENVRLTLSVRRDSFKAGPAAGQMTGPGVIA
jgi:response regulator RpfG family c-di-GMP phosphodiesterase